MAPPQGQSQRSPSQRLPEVPNGLPALKSLPHEHVGPVAYHTPDTFTTPHTPVISGNPDPNRELTTSHVSPRAYSEQLQQAFNEVESIITHRIRSHLDINYSNYWNRYWNHYYSQLCTASDNKRLKLENKVQDLTTRSNALEVDNGQLRWKCAQYSKTVFRHVSSLALQCQRMRDAKLDSGILRARILDLKAQHAEELQAKQTAIDEAKTVFQSQINNLKQVISNTDNSFKEEIQQKQELLDEQIQLCNSLEARLQEERDRMFGVKKDLALSNTAKAKLEKGVQEATLARERAEANEEAERQLSMEHVKTLQADVNSCNAVTEYLKQRSARFADSVDKHKVLVGRLRSDNERVKNDCATIEAHSTSLTHQLAKQEEESKSLREERVKLQNKLTKSTKEIDELSDEVIRKGSENYDLQDEQRRLQMENSQLLSLNQRLQRKIDVTRRRLDDDHCSDDEDYQPKDAKSTSHLTNPASLSIDHMSSSTPAPLSKAANLRNEITPPKTPHMIQAPQILPPTPSPMTSPLTHSLPPGPPPSTSPRRSSQSATSSCLVDRAESTSPERSNATKDTSYRVLSREQLAAVGRMQKRPGTEIKAPTSPRSSVSRRIWFETESRGKRRKSDFYES